MTHATMIRLPDQTGEEVQKYAKERGLAFATAIRCIVVEHMKEIAPAVNPTKTPADASQPTTS